MNHLVKCLLVAFFFLLPQPFAVAQSVPPPAGQLLSLGNNPFGDLSPGEFQPNKAYRAVTSTRTIVETHMEEISEEEQKRLHTFREAVQAMREKHDSPEEKEKAKAALETLVIEQMDRDLETREKQLAEIEAQAKQLREQLDQRKAAKPEFVKLIMMMIETPAAGIGLPSEWMNSIGPALQPSVSRALPSRSSESLPSPYYSPPTIDPGTPMQRTRQ